MDDRAPLELADFMKADYYAPSEIVEQLGSRDVEGARVLLVNMPIREQAKPNVAPLGPALLAARLIEQGAHASILDLNAYRIQDEEATRRGLPNGRVLSFDEAKGMLARTLDKIGDQDLIGFSGLITTLRWQENMAKIVRRLQPHALLISGGGLATEFRDALVSWIPELDVSHIRKRMM